ncbi:hypothetical protein [Azospirillum largimobile]
MHEAQHFLVRHDVCSFASRPRRLLRGHRLAGPDRRLRLWPTPTGWVEIERPQSGGRSSYNACAGPAEAQKNR